MDSLQGVQANLAAANSPAQVAAQAQAAREASGPAKPVGAAAQAQAAIEQKIPLNKGDAKQVKGQALKALDAAAKEGTETPGEAAVEAPPDPRAARRAKVDAIKALADGTRSAFVEGQRARQVQQQAQAEVARLRGEHEAAVKELQAAQKDPLAWLETRGVKMRALAERVAKGEQPSEAIAELQKQILAQEEKNEKLRQELQERESRAKHEAAYTAARAALLKTFEDGKTTYPTLHALVEGPEELVAEFMGMVEQIKRNPETAPFLAEYSDAEILEALEARHAKRYGRVKGAVPGAAEAGGTTQSRPTLTSRGASDTALPADFAKLPPKQQIAVLTETYKRHKKV